MSICLSWHETERYYHGKLPLTEEGLSFGPVTCRNGDKNSKFVQEQITIASSIAMKKNPLKRLFADEVTEGYAVARYILCGLSVCIMAESDCLRGEG